jgi:uncharacterized tellurite resistance protein B-like protein
MPQQSIEAQRTTATELVALTLLADGVLARRELEALDRHAIAELLGVPRDALIQAVIDHCRRLLERPLRGDSLRLVDIERFEMTLDRITDAELRLLVCRAMLVLSKADGMITQPEQTLLRNALTRWGISLEAVRA